MIELTKRERKIFDEVMEQIGRTVVLLSGLSYEEWLDQLREHQYLTLSTLSRKSAGKSILSVPVSTTGTDMEDYPALLAVLVASLARSPAWPFPVKKGGSRVCGGPLCAPMWSNRYPYFYP